MDLRRQGKNSRCLDHWKAAPWRDAEKDKTRDDMALQTSNIRLVFAHGTSFVMNRPLRLEALLDPVVLKFASLCTLLYITFASSTNGLDATFWVDASLWAITLALGISALGLVFSAIRFLMLRGAISFVYTPLIIVPLVILNEVLEQTIARGLLGSAQLPANEIIANAMQDVCALLLFDILFGTFVAPNHPYFMQKVAEGGTGAEAVEPAANSFGGQILHTNTSPLKARLTSATSRTAPSLETAYPPTPEDDFTAPATAIMQAAALPDHPQSQDEVGKILYINGEELQLSDILWVRAQDHYVRVYTQQNLYVQRANFTEFLEEFPDEAGVQVSRSAWVSFEHVSLVWRTDTMRFRVVLINGEEIQVATSRNIRVTDAMRQRGIPVIQSRNNEAKPASEARTKPAEVKFSKAG